MLPRAILRFSRTLQPPAFIFTSINVFLINEKQPLIRERLVETCIRSSKRRVNMKVQLEAQLGEQSGTSKPALLAHTEECRTAVQEVEPRPNNIKGICKNCLPKIVSCSKQSGESLPQVLWSILS